MTITTSLRRLSRITVLMAALISLPPGAMGADDVHALADANGAFALDLYARLATTGGNLFFSPYSISSCLAMTYAGARADTARQMAQTLHFSGNRDQVASAFGELQRQLNAAQNGSELNVANGLWGQKDHPFLAAFLDAARDDFQAGLNQVDFRTGAEPARAAINDWVSGQTAGKINNLLQPGILTPATRLVLVNAVSFKGRWVRPFNKTNTSNAPFSVAPDRTVQAPLMNLDANFNYAELDGLQMLELPYAGGGLSMVVALPREIGGLKTMEASLTKQTLDAWLAQAREQKVTVFLPRFKLTAQFNLARTLAEMGMKDAFSAAADFSGMDGARDLFISAVVHRAFVDVNEEGTEAAAATGAVMKMLAVRRQPAPTFRADHPFLFLIRDTHSGSILFLGRVLDPTA
ncbi:MAG: serpin family protein [Limisphaerales bacterium]